MSAANQKHGDILLTNNRPGLEIITGAESVKLMSELAEVSSINGKWVDYAEDICR